MSFNGSNTGITLEELTAEHCQIILDTYEEVGLTILRHMKNERYRQHMARDLKTKLSTSPYSTEYRPDGQSQNKLYFRAKYSEGQFYLHATASPIDHKDGERISAEYDRLIRERFGTNS